MPWVITETVSVLPNDSPWRLSYIQRYFVDLSKTRNWYFRDARKPLTCIDASVVFSLLVKEVLSAPDSGFLGCVSSHTSD